MSHLQTDVFSWAAMQSADTGLVVFCAGLVYAFHGFRLYRFLLVTTCAGLGWAAGTVVEGLLGPGVDCLGILGAVLGAAMSLAFEKPSTFLASAAVWGILSAYLAGQVGFSRGYVLGVATGGAILGGVYVLLCYRTMTIILTTLQGVCFLVIGWVILSTRLVPTIGCTFRSWANEYGLIVPAFLAMLFVTGYSYQAMRRQGDIKTGC